MQQPWDPGSIPSHLGAGDGREGPGSTLVSGQVGCPPSSRAGSKALWGWTSATSGLTVPVFCSSVAFCSALTDTQTGPWLGLFSWLVVSLLLASCPMRAGPLSLGTVPGTQGASVK